MLCSVLTQPCFQVSSSPTWRQQSEEWSRTLRISSILTGSFPTRANYSKSFEGQQLIRLLSLVMYIGGILKRARIFDSREWPVKTAASNFQGYPSARNRLSSLRCSTSTLLLQVLETRRILLNQWQTGDTNFTRTILPSVEKELQFWESKRRFSVAKDGASYNVFQYRVSDDHNEFVFPASHVLRLCLSLFSESTFHKMMPIQTASNCPRPENFLVDYWQGVNSTRKPEDVWSSTTSACESGWDFSSRWFDQNGTDACEL